MFLMLVAAVFWIKEVSWLLMSMLELSEDFLIPLRISLKVPVVGVQLEKFVDLDGVVLGNLEYFFDHFRVLQGSADMEIVLNVSEG